MSKKICFIRHAEPDRNGDLSEHGLLSAKKFIFYLKPGQKVFVSELLRSKKTAQAIFPLMEDFYSMEILNEWDKNSETEAQFKDRVERALKELPDDCVVIGHSRFMNWAHWILKGKPTLGFDYLEGFLT